jgi:hypothetical protein
VSILDGIGLHGLLIPSSMTAYGCLWLLTAKGRRLIHVQKKTTGERRNILAEGWPDLIEKTDDDIAARIPKIDFGMIIVLMSLYAKSQMHLE